MAFQMRDAHMGCEGSNAFQMSRSVSLVNDIALKGNKEKTYLYLFKAAATCKEIHICSIWTEPKSGQTADDVWQLTRDTWWRWGQRCSSWFVMPNRITLTSGDKEIWFFKLICHFLMQSWWQVHPPILMWLSWLCEIGSLTKSGLSTKEFSFSTHRDSGDRMISGFVEILNGTMENWQFPHFPAHVPTVLGFCSLIYLATSMTRVLYPQTSCPHLNSSVGPGAIA